MKGKALIKIVGLLTTIIGAGVTIVSDMVSDQKMKNEVANEVAKAMAEKK